MRCLSESGRGVSKEIGLFAMGGGNPPLDLEEEEDDSFSSEADEGTPPPTWTGAKSCERDKGRTKTVGALSGRLRVVGEKPSTSGVAAAAAVAVCKSLAAVPG